MRIEGLAPLIRALRRVDTDFPKELQRANKAHAEALVPKVRAEYESHYTRRTGRGVQSIRAVATQKTGGIRSGGARAPYMPGQEWGSNRAKQFAPRVPGGRFMRPTIQRALPELQRQQLKALDVVLAKAFTRRGR